MHLVVITPSLIHAEIKPVLGTARIKLEAISLDMAACFSRVSLACFSKSWEE